MWKCSCCKVYMNLDLRCTKCNLRQKDNFVVKVKKAELYGNKLGHLVSSKEANESKEQLPQYWECPEHGKIMRTDQVCPDSLMRID